MSGYLLIFICLLGGYFLRRFGIFTVQAPVILNRVVIYFSLPALTLAQLTSKPMGIGTVELAAGPWIVFFFCILYVWTLHSRLKLEQKVIGALLLSAGLGNTSFLGFPLLESLLGADAVPVGVIIDQLGSFLVLSTLGVIAACLLSARDLSLVGILRRLARFPPFLAVLFSLGWNLSSHGRPLPSFLLRPLQILGLTLIPLALISVGSSLNLRKAQSLNEKRLMLFALLYKLFLSPVLILAFSLLLNHAITFNVRVAVLEAAMAPMITGVILAAEYGLASSLANLILTYGIVISLMSVPLWNFLLNHLRM